MTYFTAKCQLSTFFGWKWWNLCGSYLKFPLEWLPNYLKNKFFDFCTWFGALQGSYMPMFVILHQKVLSKIYSRKIADWKLGALDRMPNAPPNNHSWPENEKGKQWDSFLSHSIFHLIFFTLSLLFLDRFSSSNLPRRRQMRLEMRKVIKLWYMVFMQSVQMF